MASLYFFFLYMIGFNDNNIEQIRFTEWTVLDFKEG